MAAIRSFRHPATHPRIRTVITDRLPQPADTEPEDRSAVGEKIQSGGLLSRLDRITLGDKENSSAEE
jgi:hypothetical protein